MARKKNLNFLMFHEVKSYKVDDPYQVIALSGQEKKTVSINESLRLLGRGEYSNIILI